MNALQNVKDKIQSRLPHGPVPLKYVHLYAQIERIDQVVTNIFTAKGI